ncbi:HEAT repeat domain-containing protein [Schlesneria paludicola]|uniref:HEAT repeat domain-containing protein n=1 Tax=Schlesneria paludicola TaxID=360056 RepID=UPI0012FCA7A9|nr:HEAT repeat domain-containing protein [Schlesneria paludicola]
MLHCTRAWAIAALLFTVASTGNAELVPDFLMESNPEFHPPAPVKRFHRDFKSLWLEALQRPEIDLQRMTAETVARAHLHGIPDLIDLAPVLETILTAPSSHPAARYAAARALIVLESRHSASKLFEAGLSHGADLRLLVEPAIARWDFAPAHAVWIRRLESSEALPTDISLAISGLGLTRHAAARPLLMKIIMDPTRRSSIRLEAAQSAGAMVESGLESEARRLSGGRPPSKFIDQLCAIRLLARHSSPDACQLLHNLASDPEASIAAAALKRLNEINPELVLPLAETAMRHADQHVREEGAVAYLRQPTIPHIERLAMLLNDPHPSVRTLVTSNLGELALKPEFDEAVRSAAMNILNGDRWQGQSHAALILGSLQHKPAADRLVALLESTRPEVMINTAWALRKLAEPLSAPQIVDKIRRQTDERKQRSIRGVDEQIAHLFEACGVMNVQAAESLMLDYIPKDLTMTRSRGAAIWALGMLHAGTSNDAICSRLIGRFLENSDKDPEPLLIKRLCVVSIARMNGKDQAPAMRQTISNGTPPTPLGLATRWAVRELTGEQLPEPEPESYPEGEWFLEPLNLTAPLSTIPLSQ